MSFEMVRNEHAVGAVRAEASSRADLTEISVSLQLAHEALQQSCLLLTRRRCLKVFHLQM